MPGIRGVKNPYPKKGEEPTNIFSRKGLQKRDPLVGDQKKYADMTGSKGDNPRKGPTKGRK